MAASLRARVGGTYRRLNVVRSGLQKQFTHGDSSNLTTVEHDRDRVRRAVVLSVAVGWLFADSGRVGIDLDAPVIEIDDPVNGKPRPGVGPELVGLIELQR